MTAEPTAPSRLTGDRKPEQDGSQTFEEDNDALHVLPLARIPLKTPALRRARLIKNSHLESVVELFNGRSMGSGQIYPEDLSRRFEIKDRADIDLIEQLAELPSYDVYSLRLELRRLGIDVEGQDALRLSQNKQSQLAEYMTVYTRPLIVQVYGGERNDIHDITQLLNLFRVPDVEAARKNLAALAAKLKVGLEQLPSFLEDYGDVYLSLSYYQKCLDENVPIVKAMFDVLAELRESANMRSNLPLMEACDRVEKRLNNLVMEVTSLTDMFRARTEDMWSDISPERFNAMRQTITSYQSKIGRNLCVIAVKMKAWSTHFPRPRAGGLYKKANIILSDIRPGIDTLADMNYADTAT
jgi:hypothetical protein